MNDRYKLCSKIQLEVCSIDVSFVLWPWFRILEMKKWTNELLVKCFAGQLGNNFIKEDEDVAEARLAFLEKNKRYRCT